MSTKPGVVTLAAKPKDEPAPNPAIEPKPAPPTMLDLFSSAAGTAAAEAPVRAGAQPSTPVTATTNNTNDEEHLLREINHNGTED